MSHYKGLCHDLGHGPFSHVFDGVFIPRMIPGCQWKHEQASVDMLQYLMEENEITLEKYGLTSTDITFITEMIIGVPNEERKGRGREKEFLYDIINNTRSGLDVDKLDYYQRDTQLCGVFASGCDYSRVRKLARVAQCDGELHIAYPEKAVNNIVSFFRTRFELHTQVYTHRVRPFNIKRASFSHKVND